jgi:hypothetical protein
VSDVYSRFLLALAWYQERGNGSTNRATAGRSFYTSLGHTNATWRVRSSLCRPSDPCGGSHLNSSFSADIVSNSVSCQDPLFMGHIMEGLKWTLESGTTLAFAKNGSVGNATGRIECVPLSSLRP